MKYTAMRICAISIVVAVLFVFASCAGKTGLKPLSGEIEYGVETKYSSDGRYFIAGYDVDFDQTTSGIAPVREIRIVDAESGLTVWNMEGLFLLYQDPLFLWSPDDRYVSMALSGRIWTDAFVVDTVNMSLHALPGLARLAPLFPDAAPEENRPDPEIIPQKWLDETTVEVNFSWYSPESPLSGGNDRFSGSYLYNVETGELTVKSL
ncbi:MAG: hypothetical protein FWD39_04945 [Clostridiales bacterium]|nr:hypothetical protein [Clostridiales bacterium]